MAYEHATFRVETDKKVITIINQKGRSKSFPRCGITKIEPFVVEMVKSGKLDELIWDL